MFGENRTHFGVFNNGDLDKKKVATLRGSNYWRVWWQTELTALVRIESLLDFKDYHSSVLTGGLT